MVKSIQQSRHFLMWQSLLSWSKAWNSCSLQILHLTNYFNTRCINKTTRNNLISKLVTTQTSQSAQALKSETTTTAEDEVQGEPIQDVVISQRPPPILELLASKHELLLSRGKSFLLLNLVLHPVDWV